MTSMDTAWALIFILLLETGKPSPTLSLNIAPMNLDTAFSKDLEMLAYHWVSNQYSRTLFVAFRTDLRWLSLRYMHV